MRLAVPVTVQMQAKRFDEEESGILGKSRLGSGFENLGGLSGGRRRGDLWPRLLQSILQFDDAALGTGNATWPWLERLVLIRLCDTKLTIDNNDSIGGIHFENAQVLYGDLLASHVSGHLLARQDSATTTLRSTRTTHDSVGQGLTVTGGLTTETPSLHTTGETHTPAIRPCIDKLTLLEPIRVDSRADIEQACRILDTELMQVAAETNLIGSEMASLGPCHVPRFLDARADLNGPVAMLLTSFVRNHLHAIQLQNGTRRALCGFRVVKCSHAFLHRDGTSARWQCVALALERGRLGGA